MLAADAALEVRVGGLAVVVCHLDELAHAVPVEHLEGVLGDDVVGEVRGQERAHVVARVPERHLRQVVGPEAEEVGHLGDLAGDERRAGDLDHCAHAELDPVLALGEHLLGHTAHEPRLVLELGDRPHKRHHDVGDRVAARGLYVERGLDDGAGLHLGDLGVDDAEAAPAQAEHGVHLGQLGDLVRHRVDGELELVGHHLAHVLHLPVGEELVEGGVEEANRDGARVHRLEDALEVGALERQQLLQRLLARRRVGRHHHLPHSHEPLVRREEHVLRAHEPDALRAVAARLRRVLGRVGVGEDLDLAPLVHPAHEGPEVPADRGRRQRLAALDHLPRVAVERDPVACRVRLPPELHRLGLVVDRQLLAPRHARLPPPARHNGRVRRHPAALRKDPLGSMHARNVLGRRLSAHEDRSTALRLEGLGLLRGEDNLPDRCAGGGGEPAADDAVLVA
mmetsp:Transcript_16591/g.40524  ORF Transcript_16591/g.40524 Transcript_16591/m.40524 type:complete len:452 (+) Transcript_16591:540-1895(+)